MNSTQQALAMFTRNCLREARRAELRDGASSVLAENRAVVSASVDPETAKWQDRARAYAGVIATVFGQTH